MKFISSLTSSTNATPARHGNFEVLRLLLAYLVIYTHSVRFLEDKGYVEAMTAIFGLSNHYGLGDLAVDGFFILSGFLITMSWERKPSLIPYFRNRVLRIYPAFIVASLVSLFIVAPFAAPSLAVWIEELSPIRIISGLTRLNQPEATVFVGIPQPYLNRSMWSLAHEFRCYMLVAFLGLILPRRWQIGAWTAILVTCIGILISGWIAPEFRYRDTIFGGNENQARIFGDFAAGALYYHLLPWHHVLRKFFPIIALTLLGTFFNESILHWTLPLLLGAFYLQIGLSQHLGKWLPKLKYDISYGVYLYAWPIQGLLRYYWPEIQLWPHVLITACLASVLGWLSWHGIESRFLKLKAR